jgi:hypothetical protein
MSVYRINTSQQEREQNQLREKRHKEKDRKEQNEKTMWVATHRAIK